MKWNFISVAFRFLSAVCDCMSILISTRHHSSRQPWRLLCFIYHNNRLNVIGRGTKTKNIYMCVCGHLLHQNQKRNKNIKLIGIGNNFRRKTFCPLCYYYLWQMINSLLISSIEMHSVFFSLCMNRVYFPIDDDFYSFDFYPHSTFG